MGKCSTTTTKVRKEGKMWKRWRGASSEFIFFLSLFCLFQCNFFFWGGGRLGLLLNGHLYHCLWFLWLAVLSVSILHGLSGKQDTVTEFGLCFLPSYYAKMSENHQCVGYHNNRLKIWSPVEKLFSVPQVVRAFGLMEWSDPRILRSLKEREKGEGALAKWGC